MSETPIVDEENKKTEKNFEDVQALQDALFEKRAIEAAQRSFSEQHEAHRLTSSEGFGTSELTETKSNRIVINERGKKVLKSVGAVAGTAAGLAVLGGIAGEAFAEPEFSEQTKTVIAEDGDGMQSLLDKAGIEGLGEIDWRDAAAYVEQLPENAGVFEDGLQVGETVTVPISIEK